MMTRVVILLARISTAEVVPAAQEQRKETTRIVYYELYSWQEKHGNWNFSLLPNTSSEKTVRQVFSPRNRIVGVEQLKKRISELPEGATVIGIGRLPTGTGPKAKGSDPLTYPPQEIVQELQHNAESRRIKIEVDSGGSR